MNKKLLNPDYIFEISWEVCNKVGGIHTVLSTKAPLLIEQFGDKLIFIGPDIHVSSNKNDEFIPDENLLPELRELLNFKKFRARIGRWNIPGKPIAILIDFTTFIPKKDEILTHFWEQYKLDSLSGGWEYIDSTLFGYAAGNVIELFYESYLYLGNNIIAHFHEWMTGSGILYLKENIPQIGTVFTTHATVVGRSLSGNNLALYDNMNSYNADNKSHDLGVVAKHSLEKLAAQNADSFTTVSEITSKECFNFLNRKTTFVTPNGFNSDITPQSEKEFLEKRKNSRNQLRKVSEALLGYKLAEDTIFIANSGRYEYRNKGIDMYIEALKNLNQDPNYKREIVAFILINVGNFGVRKDLVDKLNGKNTNILDNPFITHGIRDLNYDPILKHIKAASFSNNKDEAVKLIFVPSDLNGNDGVFNIKYYDLLCGMDLTAFPSYYEPWGYTPLESLAFGIPTITTSLAGFGVWVSKYSKSLENGAVVIERNDHNFVDASEKFAEIIRKFSGYSPELIKIIRQNAKGLAKLAEWKSFIEYYYKAYDNAIKQVIERSDSLKEIKQAEKIDVKAEKSLFPVWKKIYIKTKLPKRIEKLHELTQNLWWTWNYQATELFESMDSEKWIKCKRNPLRLLENISYDDLIKLSENDDFVAELDRVYAIFREYMDQPLKTNPSISYFSMEYGLSDTLQIFSGGLGVLAGDYIKEASDSRVNMTAVGFLYRYGYFRQTISVNNEQQAHYDRQDFSKLPVTEVKDKKGVPIVVEFPAPGRTVYIKVWRADVGRVKLYLLDTDHELNSSSDRYITHTLYGGDWENRLKQEIILGMGGMLVLKRLGIKTNLYHCNEGHAALINISRLINYTSKDYSFDEALEKVRATSLFTTHTPVPAGHDKFDEDMFRAHFRNMPEKLKISWKDFMALGRENPDDSNEKFSMSILAIKTSQYVNGVSWLHGEVSKDMFKNLWKGFFAEESPIGYVTNGVHYGTWTSIAWQQLYEKHFNPEFRNDLSNLKHWEKIQDVDDVEIWKTKSLLRKRLIDFAKKRISNNMRTSHADPVKILEVLDRIDENALTIGFARRFATYKRAHLLFTDEKRLAKLVNNPKMPVQFIFAGKAHPADGGGQALIKHIIEISQKPEFLGKIIFLENYDMTLAKRLVSGVDIWMNTPTRPLEASGTSGEKAELNGTINFSVLDGWFYEGYKEGASWCLPDKKIYNDQKNQDELDAATIYNMFEDEIIPLFYAKDKNGISKGWVKTIKNSISQIAPTYTTKRMMDDYLDRFYIPMDKRNKELKENNKALINSITDWKRKVKNSWNDIEVVKVEMPDIYSTQLGIGDIYEINLVIDLKELKDIDLCIQAIFADDDSSSKIINTEDFKLTKTEGSLKYYNLKYELKIPGSYRFGIRMYPISDSINDRRSVPCVRWI